MKSYSCRSASKAHSDLQVVFTTALPKAAEGNLVCCEAQWTAFNWETDPRLVPVKPGKLIRNQLWIIEGFQRKFLTPQHHDAFSGRPGNSLPENGIRASDRLYTEPDLPRSGHPDPRSELGGISRCQQLARTGRNRCSLAGRSGLVRRRTLSARQRHSRSLPVTPPLPKLGLDNLPASPPPSAKRHSTNACRNQYS
jgi:hypothetical protein